MTLFLTLKAILAFCIGVELIALGWWRVRFDDSTFGEIGLLVVIVGGACIWYALSILG